MMTQTQINQIIAVVDNVIRLKRASLGPELLTELRLLLTRENPAYHQMKRMRDRQGYKYRFMQMPPATISSFEEDDETIYIPRGYKRDLIELAQRHNQSVKFFDETIAYDRDAGMTLNADVQLKDYQKRGLGKLVMSREGVLVAPCGGGKTVTGIAIMMTLKQPTLVLTHTNDLVLQWCRELADKATIPGGVGQWGGGRKALKKVTVATIQTLIRMDPQSLRSFLNEFGCVILDEAHHCPADTFMGVINLCSARYRYGLTATPKRKDGLEFLMTDTIGPLLAEITDNELQAEGRSQPCIVRSLSTTFYTHHSADEWNDLMNELTQDNDRNRMIIDSVVQTWKEGHFPLVLSDRVTHCRYLATELGKRGMNAQLLIGDISKHQRGKVVEYAKRNLVDAIVATKVADEGLDIPNLSCIHLTTPTANEAKTQQRIGRIRRPMEGKVSLVVDYIDLRVAACLRMAKARKNLYRRWGFTDESGKQI